MLHVSIKLGPLLEKPFGDILNRHNSEFSQNIEKFRSEMYFFTLNRLLTEEKRKVR